MDNIRAILNENSTGLSEIFRDIKSKTINPNTDHFCIEVFFNPFPSISSVMLFSMDKDQNEVFNEGSEDYFAGSVKLIGDVEVCDEDEVDDDNYEELEDATVKEIALLVYPFVKDLNVEIFVGKHDGKMKNIKDYL